MAKKITPLGNSSTPASKEQVEAWTNNQALLGNAMIPNYSWTPEEYEKNTGDKLMSYTTNAQGKLDMYGSMGVIPQSAGEYMDRKNRYAAAVQAFERNKQTQPKEQDSLINSSYSKMIGKNGFYGSMQGLEAASMRLADAAAKREQSLIGARGSQERSLQKLRGEQELDLLKRKYDLEAEAENRLEAKSRPRKEGNVTPLPDRPGYGKGDNGLLYRKIGGIWYLSI
jgi:hypothetical protein